MISVEIRAPDLALIPHWDELAKRAEANVFMHPAALCAAAAAGFARVHVLLAWKNETLVGLWGLRERRPAPLLPAFLAAPPYEYAFVAGPVIDPDCVDAVMPAFFEAIAHARALPNVIQLKFLDAESATFRATMTALGSRPVLRLAERARPFLNGESERKRSGSTGKKLRQDWNRLSGLGAVEVTNERADEQVRDAFEIFLNLEQQSWKGDSGTALLSDEEDAAFARRWIAALGSLGCASVALLRVDGKPIAAQVLLYSRTMAYTWKTAFDVEFSKFSPGALLVDKVTDALFASGVERIESCSPPGGFMAQLWSGRRATVDMLVDVGARKSVAFRLAALSERAYAFAREQRDRLRGLAWPLPKRKSLAVTRS
jgi:CelD/BcsL family acetyltransferase involved in cellulose biosynthesis